MKEYQSQIRDCKIGKDVTIVHPVNLYECEIGDGTFIGPFVEIQKGVKIGKNCRISSHSFICEGVVIKDNCFIGHGVMFINDKKPKSNNPDWILKTTTIFENSSIGSNATILPVSIGPDAMVGAGAVVTKNVPKREVWVGNTAIPISLNSKYPNKKYKKKINKDLANYIVGFIDGEGCFTITRGTSFCFRFILESDYRDKPLYEKIKNEFDCGIIRERRRKSSVNNINCHYIMYDIRKAADIKNIIIPFFDTFQLKGLKKIKYLRWREAFLDYQKVPRGEKYKWMNSKNDNK